MLVFTLLCLVLHVQASWGGWGRWYGNSWNYNYNNNNMNNINDQNCNTLLRQCMAQELSVRLRASMNGVQPVTTTQDLIANFDTNGDQCITATEFNAVMAQRFFSAAFARYRFFTLLGSGVGTNNALCPGGISVAALRATPIVAATAATINNAQAQALINFCDQNPALYQTNCDCIQLPSVCSMQPFQTAPACTAFRTRYANNPRCPFSNIGINVAKNNCAAGNFGTANAQMIPLLRLLCNKLNQSTATTTG